MNVSTALSLHDKGEPGMKSNMEELFNKYDKINTERCSVRALDDPMFFQYRNGIVNGSYDSGDEDTLLAVRGDFPDDKVYRAVCNTLIDKRDTLSRMHERDAIRESELARCKKQLQQLSPQTLREYFDDFKAIYTYQGKDLGEDFYGLMSLDALYSEHKLRLRHPCRREQPNIQRLYGAIFGEGSQFEKYGLIPVDDERILYPLGKPARLVDKVCHKTIPLKNIPLNLAQVLFELERDGSITDLAVRLSDPDICDGEDYSVPIMEELERGEYFFLTGLGVQEISRLYTTQYEDCLWVNITHTDITFEELCEDFQDYEEMIVTQVVHLEYTLDRDIPYITHLDHEYIFYTIEEFEERKTNPHQKGEAAPRLKSFKIDRSRIPFDKIYTVTWRDNLGNDCPPAQVPFLCYVLDCYFQHKELLREYFQSLL